MIVDFGQNSHIEPKKVKAIISTFEFGIVVICLPHVQRSCDVYLGRF